MDPGTATTGLSILAALWLAAPALATSNPAAPELYQSLCAECHGADRLGAVGPALIPETLGRIMPQDALTAIMQGHPTNQMPPFADRLREQQAEGLVDYILTPVSGTPRWNMAKTLASHRVLVDPSALPDRPVHDSDPMNLFVVLEMGDHHATVLDGDRLEPIHRFPTRNALNGGPEFSVTGRFVYFASRDGWISKFDLHSLQAVAEIRAGIDTSNLAVSGDGRYLAVASNLPHTLVILDANDLSPIKLIPVEDGMGNSSRVSAVYAAPPRQSFVAALQDIPEVWEILLADDPPPVYNGPMHDYRLGEGTARVTGRFPARRVPLDDYLEDLFFDQSYSLVIGAARNARSGQVIHLDARRKIAELELDGPPRPGAGITWEHENRWVLATPHLGKTGIAIVDLASWRNLKEIETPGSGFFLRSHADTPYVWVVGFFGSDKDTLQIIDKRTLKTVNTLRPDPGKRAAHVAFDRYGRYALVPISEMDGALVVYDAQSLDEIKRLPMRKPSWTYNVQNRTIRPAETIR